LVGSALLVGVVAACLIGWKGYGIYRARNSRIHPSTVPARARGEVPLKTRRVADQKPKTPAVQQDEDLTRQAERLFWLGDFSESEKLWRRARKEGVGNPAELDNNLGLVLEKEGKLKQALTLLDEAVRAEPKMVEALSNRGIVNRKLKRYKSAEADLKRALDLDPHFTHAQFNLATVYEAMGRTKDAILYYRMYLKNRARSPGLDEVLILQRISALESRVSGVSYSPGGHVKER